MSVFLRKQNLKKGVYLSFIEAFYNSDSKNTTQKTIRKIGYVDDLKKTYTDPIAYFTEEAKKLSLESSKKYSDSKIAPIPRQRVLKNVGYFLPRYVYGKFHFDSVFKAITFDRRFKFSVESVFQFCVFSQIVNPSSKQSEFKNKDQFFDRFLFSDDQLYDGIKCIGENEELIKEYIQLRTKEIVKIDSSKTYFDGTNIYFEIDKENEELKRGPEKNNRHDPIIGMGLLMDANGYPINYSLFPGNSSEQPQLHKNLRDLKKKDGIKGRTIITADKGLNSGDNMYEAVQNGDGYVIGQRIRGGSQDLIDWVLEDDLESSYQKTYDSNGVLTYKVKSEVGYYDVKITSPLNGQKSLVKLSQKRVVFWSKDYSDKAKYERQKIIDKAKDIITNPKKYLKSTVGDAATYIKQINYDKNGEIVTNTDFVLDEESIEKAALLDGYYLIVTSEKNLSDDKIIKIYRGLWEIEETFSIVKGVLKVRPVFAKSLVAVHAHMLICFTSLLILRILQKKILLKELTNEQVSAIIEANTRKRKHKIQYKKVVEYPITQICSFIREYNVAEIDGIYYTEKYNELIPFIEERFNVKLDRNMLTRENIKNIFSSVPQHKTKIIN